jgi:arabinofuranan 3-O-arabinosyltransferase
VDDGGWVQFPAVRTRQLTLRFPKPEPVFTADPRSHGLTLLPVGIAEIQVPAISDLMSPWDRDAPVFLPCGAGPAVKVDGRQVPTTVTGTVGDLMDRARVFVRACETVVLAPGKHAVEAPDEWLRIDRLAMVADQATPDGPQPQREIVREDGSATVRHLALGAGGRTVVALGENYNAGWAASMDGGPLRPVRLDGWQQGFVVEQGAAGVLTVHYEPNRTYRLGLGAGLLALLAALGLLLLPGRARRPAVGPALLGGWTVTLIALGSLVALAGPVGGVLGGLTLLAARWRRAQVWPDWAPLVPASGLVLVGVLGALGLYGANALRTTATAAQVLAVVALASVWSTFCWGSRGASSRLVRPRPGGDQSL